MFKSLVSSSRRRSFLTLLIFHASYLWFRSFSSSSLAPHFLKSGVSLEQMFFGNILAFIVPVAMILFWPKVNNLLWWRWSLILSFLAILVIIKVDFIWQYYLYNLLIGTNTALFYIPYNIAHFQLTPKNNNSFSSGIMFSLYPIISLITPIAAGFLAEINYIYIWILSFIFFIVSYYLIKFQPSINLTISLKSTLTYLRPTRIFVLLQGIWETVVFGLIPIFTLYFITTPFAYGTFLAYLALMGIFANLLLGRLSDRLKNRILFLFPITIVMALATLFLPLGLTSLILWLIITGIIEFICPLFWNFSTAFFVDLQPDNHQAMPAREFILNCGRVLGVSLAFISFKFQVNPIFICSFLAGTMLLYPVLLFYNKPYAAKS